jgi:hypothetical protein
MKNKKEILIPYNIDKIKHLKIDLDILKDYIKNDMESNKEYFEDLNITYRISNPKKAEWILSKAIKNCKLVGNGNNNIDICINNIGIDVSVLTLNGNYTNEKSIMQNFKQSNDLDSLFNTNEGEKALNIFKEKFKDKCEFSSNNKKNIYYMIFICKNKNIYLACLKLYTKNIDNMKFSCFTKTNKNINIDNFIHKKFGNIKLYKSKKRLELRLSKNIIHKYSIKLY